MGGSSQPTPHDRQQEEDISVGNSDQNAVSPTKPEVNEREPTALPPCGYRSMGCTGEVRALGSFPSPCLHDTHSPRYFSLTLATVLSRTFMTCLEQSVPGLKFCKFLHLSPVKILENSL